MNTFHVQDGIWGQVHDNVKVAASGVKPRAICCLNHVFESRQIVANGLFDPQGLAGYSNVPDPLRDRGEINCSGMFIDKANQPDVFHFLRSQLL